MITKYYNKENKEVSKKKFNKLVRNNKFWIEKQFDNENNILTEKDSNGGWIKHIYKNNGYSEYIIQTSKGERIKHTYVNGREVICKFTGYYTKFNECES